MKVKISLHHYENGLLLAYGVFRDTKEAFAWVSTFAKIDKIVSKIVWL